MGATLALIPKKPAAHSTTSDTPAIQAQAGAYLAGRFAQHVDDWKAAADYMGDALVQDPNDPSLLRRAFLLDLGDGRIPAALPLARRLTKEDDPNTPLAILLLIVDDVVNGRLDDADGRLGTLGTDGITKYTVPLLAGWLALAKDQAKDAETALAPLEATQGLGVLYALHRALIADVANDRDTAAHWYDEAIKDSPPTLRVVQAAGSFLQRTGHDDQAQALYADFAKDNANAVLLDPSALVEEADLGKVPAVISARDGMAESLFELASFLHQEESDEMAMIYARLALILRPQFPLTQLLVGDILVNRSHDEEALLQYQDVARDGPLGWSARLRTSESLIRLGRNDEAATLLEAMAAEHTDRADPLVRLGDLYRDEKKDAEAIKAYDRALERIPHLEERHWTILYGRAASYERLGPWEKSEQDLQAALALSKDQASVLNFLGYSWVDKNINLPQARTMIERAVALQPKNGYIIDSLGWALYRMGDLQGAVTELERAIELKPLDPTINDHLGDAYWAVGRQIEALFQWRRSLQESDDQELSDAVRKKLKERSAVDPGIAGTPNGAL
jgi:tetratricopeptide (TPR) repeat protein